MTEGGSVFKDLVGKKSRNYQYFRGFRSVKSVFFTMRICFHPWEYNTNIAAV